jgi:DNA-binding NarL/FixJ family response regulator
LRVLIAEDSPAFAATLEELLGRDERIDVVGVAADGQEAVEMVRLLDPDMVLMDIHMPRLDGLAATREIREQGASMAIVILSGDDASMASDALDAGASAFVRKSDGAEAILGVLFELGALIALARAPASSIAPP